MSTEPATQRDLQHLEQLVESRFAALERWIQQATQAIQSMADQAPRISVLETKVAKQEEEIEGLQQDVRAIGTRLLKISAWITAGVGIGALVLPPVIEKVLGL
jgi:predicted  nucleic acid-binding Zn-ribbon protein